MITPANLIAALLTLIPFLGAAFFPERVAGGVRRLPLWAKIFMPAALSMPYLLVAFGAGVFRWGWLALYAALPVAIAGLLEQARRIDSVPGGLRGNWRDYLVLAALGLAVDLRWFEGAWPAHLAIFNKMLLLDAGIYGFIYVRQLDGVGFDLRLRLARCGHRSARARLVHADRPGAGPGVGLSAFASGLAGVPSDGSWSLGWLAGTGADCRGMVLHLLLHRRAGGALFSRLAPESSGAAYRPHRGAASDRRHFRAFPLQQADGILQLALRAIGRGSGRLLWAGMAAGAPGGRIGYHPRLGRRDLVSMAAVRQPACARARRSGNPGQPACCGPPVRGRRWRW